MFLISMDRSKVLDMKDIKGYFIYKKNTDGTYDFPAQSAEDIEETADENKNSKYVLWANIGWQNPYCSDCHQYSVGTYGNLPDAIRAMETLALSDPTEKGVVMLSNNEIKFGKMQ